MNNEKEIPKIYIVIATILLMPIVIPCMLIIVIAILLVGLIIGIPVLIIGLIKECGKMAINYFSYKKQVRKILKDFEEGRKVK